MNIFVSGASGFIGRHVVKEAERNGYNVFAEKIPSPETLSKCGVLVHLMAAGVNDPSLDWKSLYETNVDSSLRLWKLGKQTGINRFIVIGSCFEYGRSGDKYDKIPINAPLLPVTRYAASKAAASVTAIGFSVDSNSELLLLRLFQVYGEGEAPTRFYPSICHAAINGRDFPMTHGNQIRDFVQVDYVAKYIISSLSRKDIHPGHPIVENVGTGIGTKLRTFAQKIWSEKNATGKLLFGDLPYRRNEVMSYVAEI